MGINAASERRMHQAAVRALRRTGIPDESISSFLGPAPVALTAEERNLARIEELRRVAAEALAADNVAFTPEEAEYVARRLLRAAYAPPDYREWTVKSCLGALAGEFAGRQAHTRRIVEHFSEIAADISVTLRLEPPFSWSEVCHLYVFGREHGGSRIGSNFLHCLPRAHVSDRLTSLGSETAYTAFKTIRAKIEAHPVLGLLHRPLLGSVTGGNNRPPESIKEAIAPLFRRAAPQLSRGALELIAFQARGGAVEDAGEQERIIASGDSRLGDRDKIRKQLSLFREFGKLAARAAGYVDQPQITFFQMVTHYLLAEKKERGAVPERFADSEMGRRTGPGNLASSIIFFLELAEKWSKNGGPCVDRRGMKQILKDGSLPAKPVALPPIRQSAAPDAQRADAGTVVNAAYLLFRFARVITCRETVNTAVSLRDVLGPCITAVLKEGWCAAEQPEKIVNALEECAAGARAAENLPAEFSGHIFFRLFCVLGVKSGPLETPTPRKIYRGMQEARLLPLTKSVEMQTLYNVFRVYVAALDAHPDLHGQASETRRTFRPDVTPEPKSGTCRLEEFRVGLLEWGRLRRRGQERLAGAALSRMPPDLEFRAWEAEISALHDLRGVLHPAKLLYQVLGGETARSRLNFLCEVALSAAGVESEARVQQLFFLRRLDEALGDLFGRLEAWANRGAGKESACNEETRLFARSESGRRSATEITAPLTESSEPLGAVGDRSTPHPRYHEQDKGLNGDALARYREEVYQFFRTGLISRGLDAATAHALAVPGAECHEEVALLRGLHLGGSVHLVRGWSDPKVFARGTAAIADSATMRCHATSLEKAATRDAVRSNEFSIIHLNCPVPLEQSHFSSLSELRLAARALVAVTFPSGPWGESSGPTAQGSVSSAMSGRGVLETSSWLGDSVLELLVLSKVGLRHQDAPIAYALRSNAALARSRGVWEYAVVRDALGCAFKRLMTCREIARHLDPREFAEMGLDLLFKRPKVMWLEKSLIKNSSGGSFHSFRAALETPDACYLQNIFGREILFPLVEHILLKSPSGSREDLERTAGNHCIEIETDEIKRVRIEYVSQGRRLCLRSASLAAVRESLRAYREMQGRYLEGQAIRDIERKPVVWSGEGS